jgi:hypothetical protein
MTRTKFGSTHAFLIEASWSVIGNAEEEQVFQFDDDTTVCCFFDSNGYCLAVSIVGGSAKVVCWNVSSSLSDHSDYGFAMGFPFNDYLLLQATIETANIRCYTSLFLGHSDPNALHTDENP